MFNVCGSPATFGELLAACATGTGSDAKPTWVSEQLLLDEGAEPFDELPLWLPDEPDNRAFYSFSNARALAAGLTLRPLAETAARHLGMDRLGAGGRVAGSRPRRVRGPRPEPGARGGDHQIFIRRVVSTQPL